MTCRSERLRRCAYRVAVCLEWLGYAFVALAAWALILAALRAGELLGGRL